MIAVIVVAAIILLGFALKLTGAFLTGLLWLCVKLPGGIIACALGVVLCCTLIFIKPGLKCLKRGITWILPL